MIPNFYPIMYIEILDLLKLIFINNYKTHPLEYNSSSNE